MFKKMWKRLWCKHKRQELVKNDLVMQDNGKWKTKHTWRCKDCGKIL